MDLRDHPYAAFLHRVSKPARYVGGEVNQVVKDPGSVRVRMALAFPDVYDVGMSHLGTKILYAVLNRRPEIAAERAFCPWVDLEAELRSRGLPLVSLETATPLSQFDVVGFSLQYELTYTNVLTMLDLSGIPLHGADRDERHPLVIAGGPVATQAEPMAPFLDAFLIGDAEERLPEMLLRVADLKRAGASRRALLREVARLEGFYVPALYRTEIDPRSGYQVVGEPVEPGIPSRIRRQVVDDLDRHPFPDDAPVAAAEAIFDRMGIEIARGCTEGCRFCQAGMIYRPVRERDPERLVETIVSAVRKGGYDEVGLTTLSTADYSCISPLIKKVMENLRPEKTSLSVASLRAYGLDDDLLGEIRSVRATGLTFAPEAGTQRMRDVINKNVSEEDMQRTAHRVFGHGWRRMKLYFMIGLPTETDEDVTGIMETGRRMKEIGAGYHPRGAVRLTVSVSSHVPKPHTPFQWCAMDSLEEIERKQDLLQTLARRHRLEFRRHDPRATVLECVLGRGDRRMAGVIEDAWRAGARFDSWDDRFRWELWVRAMEGRPQIPYDLFLGTLPTDARLPWDHLDMRLEPRFLITEYRRTLKGKLSPPCGKPVGAQVHHTNLEDHDRDRRILVCYHCGVECDMTRMREERGEFLAKLGATRAPGPARPAGDAPAVEIETAERASPPRNGKTGAAQTKGSGAAPHDFRQGEPLRFRVRYAKTGFAVLTGHLDFIRALPRVLKRAGIPAYYSEGFHPKPVMEFAPPLPLGTSSLDEVVELALTEDVSPDRLVARLQEHAPAGLIFLAAERRPAGSPKLSRELAASEYAVRMDAARLHASGRTEDALAALPARFLRRTEAFLRVERKRRPKEVDIRPAVDDVAWIDPAALPSGLDWPAAGGRILWMRLLTDAVAHARPEEVARLVLGADLEIESASVARLALLRVAPEGWRPLVASTPAAGVDPGTLHLPVRNPTLTPR